MAAKFTIGAPLTLKDVVDVGALCTSVVVPEGGLPAPAAAAQEAPLLPPLPAGGGGGAPLSAAQCRAVP
jgi:hypothetical protein